MESKEMEYAEQKVKKAIAGLFKELLKKEHLNEHYARVSVSDFCSSVIWDCVFEVQKNQNGGAE